MTRRGSPCSAHHAGVEPQRLVAEPRHQVERVRHQQDRAAAAAELRELVEALVRKRLVADREHLVDEQHVRIDVMATANPRRMYMPDEYVFTGASMKSSSSANATISSKRAAISRFDEPEHHAVDEDVLAAGDLGMKAGAELDQRRDAAVDRDRARRRPADAGDQLQHRALAGAVATDDAERLAGGDVERHALQRFEGLVGPAGRAATRPDRSALFSVPNCFRRP